MTGETDLAYDVYCTMDIDTGSLVVLDFIANECYKVPCYTHRRLYLALRCYKVCDK